MHHYTVTHYTDTESMKAPAYREHIHHVRTERDVSTYQLRTGAGEKAQVIATITVANGGQTVYCVTCRSLDCSHATKIREKRGTNG